MPQYQYVRTSDAPEAGEALLQVGKLLNQIQHDAQTNQLLMMQMRLQDQRTQAEQARTQLLTQQMEQRGQMFPLQMEKAQAQTGLAGARTEEAQARTEKVGIEKDNLTNPNSLQNQIQAERLANLANAHAKSSIEVAKMTQDALDRPDADSWIAEMTGQLIAKQMPGLDTKSSGYFKAIARPQVAKMILQAGQQQEKNAMDATKMATAAQIQAQHLKDMDQQRKRSLIKDSYKNPRSEAILKEQYPDDPEVQAALSVKGFSLNQDPLKVADQGLLSENPDDRYNALVTSMTLHGHQLPMAEVPPKESWGVPTKQIDTATLRKATDYLGKFIDKKGSSTRPAAKPASQPASNGDGSSQENPIQLPAGKAGADAVYAGTYSGKWIRTESGVVSKAP